MYKAGGSALFDKDLFRKKRHRIPVEEMKDVQAGRQSVNIHGELILRTAFFPDDLAREIVELGEQRLFRTRRSLDMKDLTRRVREYFTGGRGLQYRPFARGSFQR